MSIIQLDFFRLHSLSRPSLLIALSLTIEVRTICNGGSQMGLLIRTDNEERARREADRLCTCFGAMARTLSVTKVVTQ